MNLIDCYVTAVTGSPRELYGKWWVPVKYDSLWPWDGSSYGNTEIMCKTREEAEKVAVGDVFQS